MKVFRPLKKMILCLFLTVLLLIVQAICELNLPSYTSNIINIGIGNKGIESMFPMVLREQEMSKILVNVNEEDEKKVLDSYNLISLANISKKEYLTYKEKYPIIDNHLGTMAFSFNPICAYQEYLQMKDDLYAILYEYVINNYIKEDESIKEAERNQ